MDIGTQLTQITLGMHQLYRELEGGEGVLDREGLVPVILTDVSPTRFADWEDAETHLLSLTKHLTKVTEPLRRDYLTEMIDSLRGLIVTFRGNEQNYIERVERCLRVSARPVSQDVMDDYRDEIDRLLKQMGYVQGSLAERIMRWESENQVSPDDVLATLNELLNQAQRRTDEMVFSLPDLKMTPIAVRQVPFAAYCDYQNRALHINLDMLYTRSALKHLACHEAFPGHTAHLAVREERTRRGEMPLDAALVITSSASSPLFEGIGENGIFFLDWIEESADLLGMTLSRLRSGARVNAALMIHHEHKPLDQVRAYLLETCYTTPAWVESRLAFLTHSLRAPFIFAYWYGDMAVAQVWRKVRSHQQQEFFRYLYYNMHTPTTLDNFWRDSSAAQGAVGIKQN